MTKRIDFDSKNGQKIQGELAEPPGSGKAPGLIVIQEWWGVNDHIRSCVDRFAAEGFLALAPDLYRGKTTKDPGEALKLMQALDFQVAGQDVAAALLALQAHPRFGGKAGITGFCMGGAVALTAASKLPGLAACVTFYGIADANADFSGMKAKVLGHFAQHDDHVTPERVDALEKRLKEQGKPAEIVRYDAHHAFMNDTRPEVYDAKQAKVAWDRTTSFFHRELG